MVDDAVTDDIIAIIRDHCSSSKQVDTNTRLLHDLMLMGDDIDEIISEIRKKWSVDFTGFQIKRHFPGEYLAPFCVILNWVGMFDKGRYEVVTVADFIIAVRDGAWKYREHPNLQTDK